LWRDGLWVNFAFKPLINPSTMNPTLTAVITRSAIGHRAIQAGVLAWLLALSTVAYGQSVITNRYRNAPLSLANGTISTTPSATDTWTIEKTGDGNFVRLKHTATGQYLHTESGTLQAGTIQPGWWSAMWTLRPNGYGYTQIVNRFRNTFIHNENGPVMAGPLGRADWWSAQWTITTPATPPRPFPGADAKLTRTPGERFKDPTANGLYIDGVKYVDGEAARLTYGTVTPTTTGRYLEYTFSNIPDKTLNGHNSVANMKFNVKAAVKDGLLYVHLTTENSAINIDPAKLKNTRLERGFFTNSVQTTISAPAEFELDVWGPQNINSEGTLTDMREFQVGLSKDGPSVNYTMGSQYTKTIRDFSFTDKTYKDMVQGVWQLTKVLPLKTAGQYSSLDELPALASSNFPIYTQAIYKAKTKNYIPKSVDIMLKLKPQFKHFALVSNQGNPAQAFFESFVFWANPKTYEGTLAYRVGEETFNTPEVVYTIRVDLTPLQKPQ
jgi:hypothetical protein